MHVLSLALLILVLIVPAMTNFSNKTHLFFDLPRILRVFRDLFFNTCNVLSLTKSPAKKGALADKAPLSGNNSESPLFQDFDYFIRW
jgi:hypothetical protein